MPLTFTSTAGTASSSRYIEVFRVLDGAYVSRHNNETEATESAYNDAETNGEGVYEFRYPNKMLVIRKSGSLSAPSPVPDAVEINSVNGGASVYNNQSSVFIVGTGFGIQQGSVTLNSTPLIIQSWGDSLIEVPWVDIPTNPDYSSVDFNSSLTLTVNAASGTSSISVTTIPNPAYFYALITSASEPSIYSNDTSIEVGADKGYVRLLTGSANSIDAATGIVDGATNGTQVEYIVYDVSLASWSNTAVETFYSV